MTATLADVFGAKENVVGCVSRGARAARGAARSKVREDLTEAAALRGKHAINAHSKNVDGAVALVGLVREGRCVVRLVLEPGRGLRGRASVSKKAQEVAMKATSRYVVGTRVSGAC